MNPQSQRLIEFLTAHGMASSSQIQAALKVSQPTVSRLLASVADDVIACGSGKASRYAVAQPIGRFPAQQPIWLIAENGLPTRLGTLSLLAKAQLHIEAPGVNEVFEPTPAAQLPWYLSPLRAQGYLGRLLAQQLAAQGLAPNPDTWGSESVLLAAIHTHDAPGALLLGEVAAHHPARPLALPTLNPGAVLDHLASDVAKTLPMGSSAGGEQPKFLATNEAGDPCLVKFSPPRGTPFGERWSDLLCAEALCNEVLTRHGSSTAQSHIVQTATRTYLVSQRFDRVGRYGRQHIVSVGAAHAAFVKGGYVNWAATADVLVRQGRLKKEEAETLRTHLHFGRLIGNTDMHSGNAGLFVKGATLAELSKGQFALAPVYDMLPMRWKPDPMVGLPDYAPFELDFSLATQASTSAARNFWMSLAEHPLVSRSLQEVAAVITDR
ncbi:MAG: HipA domain-containing protein [Rhodoferax sp.]|nr:HipA domain-containing protein [Rhodoferax sp.]